MPPGKNPVIPPPIPAPVLAAPPPNNPANGFIPASKAVLANPVRPPNTSPNPVPLETVCDIGTL